MFDFKKEKKTVNGHKGNDKVKSFCWGNAAFCKDRSKTLMVVCEMQEQEWEEMMLRAGKYQRNWC
jgi:hypothetical protein